MEFEVRPLAGVNDLTLGLPRDAVVAALEELGRPEDYRRTPQGTDGFCLFRPSGLGVFTYLDAAGRLDAVELGAPTAHAGDDVDRVVWRGQDLFGAPADDVVATVRQAAHVDVEEGGTSFLARELGLGLWRPAVEDAFFASVLVGRATGRR